MFEWFHEQKISRLVELAEVFVKANYKEPPKPPEEFSDTIQYSRRPGYGRKPEPEISYSIEDDDTECSNSDIRYSLRDNYDSYSIDLAVRSLSSVGSPLKTLRVLEDNTNMSFVDKMLEYINIGHLRDSDVYKAAQIDRRLFSKIVSDRTYKPAKDTCIALALALKLSLSEADDILSRAGYTLSHSSKRDVVIEYFFRERIYDLNDVNEILYRLELKLIGRL